VVASHGSDSFCRRDVGVLIPFIAGQWSLLSADEAEIDQFDLVLIPFIAGQWSLQPSWIRFLEVRGMS